MSRSLRILVAFLAVGLTATTASADSDRTIVEVTSPEPIALQELKDRIPGITILVQTKPGWFLKKSVAYLAIPRSSWGTARIVLGGSGKAADAWTSEHSGYATKVVSTIRLQLGLRDGNGVVTKYPIDLAPGAFDLERDFKLRKGVKLTPSSLLASPFATVDPTVERALKHAGVAIDGLSLADNLHRPITRRTFGQYMDSTAYDLRTQVPVPKPRPLIRPAARRNR